MLTLACVEVGKKMSWNFILMERLLCVGGGDSSADAGRIDANIAPLEHSAEPVVSVSKLHRASPTNWRLLVSFMKRVRCELMYPTCRSAF